MVHTRYALLRLALALAAGGAAMMMSDMLPLTTRTPPATFDAGTMQA